MEKKKPCQSGHEDEPRMICSQCGAILCSYCVQRHILDFQHQQHLIPFSVYAQQRLGEQSDYVSAAENLSRFTQQVRELLDPALSATVPEDDFHEAILKARAGMTERKVAFAKMKARFLGSADLVLQEAQRILRKRRYLVDEMMPKVRRMMEAKEFYEACLAIMQMETLEKTHDEEESRLQEQVAALWADDPRRLTISRMELRTADELRKGSESQLSSLLQPALKRIMGELHDFSVRLASLDMMLDRCKQTISYSSSTLCPTILGEKRRKLEALRAQKFAETPSWFVHHFGEGDVQHLYLYDLERKFPRVVALPYPNVPKRIIASAQQDDNIYISGGFDGKQFLATTMECRVRPDLTALARQVANMRVGKDCHALVAVHNRLGRFIYSLGGYNGVRLNVCEKYVVERNEWEQAAPLPLEWCGFGGTCVFSRRYIYVFDGSLSHKDICSLDTEEPGIPWDLVTYCNPAGWSYASWGGAAQISGTEILVFLQSNKSFVYNMAKGSFERKYELPGNDRFIHTYPVTYKSEVYVVGLESKDIFVFSLKDRTWRTEPHGQWISRGFYD